VFGNSEGNGMEDAAVGVVIRWVGGCLEVLFVGRVVRTGDPWSGQVGLPGGRRVVGDHDLWITVVREVCEETGVDLERSACFVGLLSAAEPVNMVGMRVLPFVFCLKNDVRIKLSKDELDWFRWVGVDELQKNRRVMNLSCFGEQPAFAISGMQPIWGLTYRIIEEFLTVAERWERKDQVKDGESSGLKEGDLKDRSKQARAKSRKCVQHPGLRCPNPDEPCIFAEMSVKDEDSV
jgi:8-oxo-dGTP pyrophosphatase MutT (NUDIX family)